VKKVLKSSLLFLGLALTVGGSAAAHADPWSQHHYNDRYPPRPEQARKAPEVDPSLAIGGLSLLGGSIAVLRARRGK
jgi:hypothetical protein